MADALEIHVTMPDGETAQTLARALVDEELAACVNIVPGVRSIYRFEDKVHEEDEVLCLVKTHPAMFERLRDRIHANGGFSDRTRPATPRHGERFRTRAAGRCRRSAALGTSAKPPTSADQGWHAILGVGADH